MVDGFAIKINGVPELQKKIKNLETELQQALSEAVSAGAAVVERDAKMRAPVVTGRLRNSIRELQNNVSATRVESQIGTDVEYAPAVEFGTSRRRAKPYLRPALDENKAEIQAAIELKLLAIIMRYK